MSWFTMATKRSPKTNVVLAIVPITFHSSLKSSNLRLRELMLFLGLREEAILERVIFSALIRASYILLISFPAA
jgi:hypothetical protein